MKIQSEVKKCIGVAVPLSALRTSESPVIGEYTALVEFAKFSKKAGFSVIQLLPILDTGTQSSPYSSLSAFALHPIYIRLKSISTFDKCYSHDPDFKVLYDELVSLSDAKRFDYLRIKNLKYALLRKIFLMGVFGGLDIGKDRKTEIDAFVEKNAEWAIPYCVFKNLKFKYMQAGCKTWDAFDRNLSKKEILKRWKDSSMMIDHYFYAWLQLTAHEQLSEAAAKVRSLGLILKCDLPILLNEDSCDVWSNQKLFNMKLRAGSPPDDDNPTGQNWGFPVYDWKAQAKDDYSWWKQRFALAEQYFDAYRLDHILGFFRFWATHEGESTAELGGTVPHTTFSKEKLLKLGFSKERIRWLSEPHLSTEEFFRRTGDFDKAHEILSLFCERIGHEELWLFKKDFKSTTDIKNVSLDGFELDEQIQHELIDLFCHWWLNRTLIEIKRGEYIPFHDFENTRAWKSLYPSEKEALLDVINENNKKQEKKWKSQAKKIFSSIIPYTKMIPCGEDLGRNIDCMPKVLDEFGILGLRVIRWCRDWESEEKPFDDFEKYRKLSLVTTSVHDSSTLRQWWNTEKEATKAFCLSIIERRKAKSKSEKTEMNAEIWGRRFDPVVAEFVLSNVAETNGVWFVNPLQDWLYLDSEFYSENQDEERINVPGTVSDFNWTWRMPCSVEKLSEKSELIEKIKKIAEIHNK